MNYDMVWLVSCHNLEFLTKKPLWLQALATALSVLASVPLGELFFFHMILIRKVSHFVVTCHYLFHFIRSCPRMHHVIWLLLLHNVFQGITTYEYVVAMRAQSEPPGPSVIDDQQSLASSPMSSTPTGFSGSSFARHYKGAWCTPPRIFIDQVLIVPLSCVHGLLPAVTFWVALSQSF